jgi:hypothetical protein
VLLWLIRLTNIAKICGICKLLVSCLTERWFVDGMKQLKTSEELDVVLGYMKNHPDIELTTGDISGYVELTNPGIFTLKDLNTILKILANDHHIEILTPGLYRVTFEGIVFMEDGGYTVNRREKFNKRQYMRYRVYELI